MKPLPLAFALLAAAAFAGCASAEKEEAEDKDHEEDVALEGVPSAVRSAVEAACPGIKIEKATRETDEGREYFELGGTLGGNRVEVTSTPAGEITAVEQVIPIESVPEAARAAATAKVPGIVWNRAEKILEKGLAKYELRGKVGGKVYEVSVTASGEVLEVEE